MSNSDTKYFGDYQGSELPHPISGVIHSVLYIWFCGRPSF